MQYQVYSNGDELTQSSDYFCASMSRGTRLACYMTALFYGGTCWFHTPTDEEKEIATNFANKKYGAKVKLEYIGRTENNEYSCKQLY